MSEITILKLMLKLQLNASCTAKKRKLHTRKLATFSSI